MRMRAEAVFSLLAEAARARNSALASDAATSTASANVIAAGPIEAFSRGQLALTNHSPELVANLCESFKQKVPERASSMAYLRCGSFLLEVADLSIYVSI